MPALFEAHIVGTNHPKEQPDWRKILQLCTPVTNRLVDGFSNVAFTVDDSARTSQKSFELRVQDNDFAAVPHNISKICLHSEATDVSACYENDYGFWHTAEDGTFSYKPDLGIWQFCLALPMATYSSIAPHHPEWLLEQLWSHLAALSPTFGAAGEEFEVFEYAELVVMEEMAPADIPADIIVMQISKAAADYATLGRPYKLVPGGLLLLPFADEDYPINH